LDELDRSNTGAANVRAKSEILGRLEMSALGQKRTFDSPRNGIRTAAKTGASAESALLESRYKPLVLLIELNADSVFWYKYTIESSVFRCFSALSTSHSML
jgi:hypothetical protein